MKLSNHIVVVDSVEIDEGELMGVYAHVREAPGGSVSSYSADLGIPESRLREELRMLQVAGMVQQIRNGRGTFEPVGGRSWKLPPRAWNSRAAPTVNALWGREVTKKDLLYFHRVWHKFLEKHDTSPQLIPEYQIQGCFPWHLHKRMEEHGGALDTLIEASTGALPTIGSPVKKYHWATYNLLDLNGIVPNQIPAYAQLGCYPTEVDKGMHHHRDALAILMEIADGKPRYKQTAPQPVQRKPHRPSRKRLLMERLKATTTFHL